MHVPEELKLLLTMTGYKQLSADDVEKNRQSDVNRYEQFWRKDVNSTEVILMVDHPNDPPTIFFRYPIGITTEVKSMDDLRTILGGF